MTTVTLIEDELTGDLILPFPDGFTDSLGWEIGDTLLWDVQPDGSIILTKKEAIQEKPMLTLERLKEIIDQNFGTPFLEKDLVTANLDNEDGEKTLSITIGRRDIQINEAGKVVGSGTMLG